MRAVDGIGVCCAEAAVLCRLWLLLVIKFEDKGTEERRNEFVKQTDILEERGEV